MTFQTVWECTIELGRRHKDEKKDLRTSHKDTQPKTVMGQVEKGTNCYNATSSAILFREPEQCKFGLKEINGRLVNA